jgi:uncharacterized protein YcfJ
MIEQTTTERETDTKEGLGPDETIQKTSVQGVAPHGDEEAGGALAGGVAGAAVGAVVGGPVGAVVGGAIGAASGATAGAIDTRSKDEVVVTTEERHS